MPLLGRELLLDAIKGGVLTLALFLAYVSFPVFGLIPGIFTPLPAIYFFCKRGAATGIAIFTITIIVLIVMGDLSMPSLYFLQAGFFSLLFPWYYITGKGTARSMALPVGINFLLIVAFAVGYGYWTGTDIQAILSRGIRNSAEQAITVYSKQGLPSADLEALSQGIRQAGDLITRIFPALLLVSLASIAILNVMVFFKFAGRWLTSLPEPDSFQAYKNPETFVWVVIFAGFSMLLPQAEIRGAALNIIIVSGFIYFLQGLAVIISFFQRLSVPSLARFIFWLVLMFQPYFVLAISFLGIFDIWADFRSPKQKNL